MDTATEFHVALAALGWLVDLGADEAISDEPVNRYDAARAAEVPAEVPAEVAVPVLAGRRPAVVAPAAVPGGDAVAAAQAAASGAASLEALRAAMACYEHCELKKGAKTLVFADGDPGARVMLVGEAPGRDEDIEGRPFVGRAGQLLDRMLSAIGLARDAPDPARGVYITNVMPWRPPQNRDPTPAEIAMLLPFLRRHIALVDPALVVVMGNTPCAALLGKTGITRLRGQWAEAEGRPVLPMFHPAYLLRQPAMKREAWADLLALQAKLRGIP